MIGHSLGRMGRRRRRTLEFSLAAARGALLVARLADGCLVAGRVTRPFKVLPVRALRALLAHDVGDDAALLCDVLAR